MPSSRGVAATDVLVGVQGVGDPEEHQQDVVGHYHEHDFILEMIRLDYIKSWNEGPFEGS